MITPIRGRDTISAADALQRIRSASPRDVRPADTADYVRELVTLCVAFNLRHTVLLAQWHHETGGGGPEGRWRELNPAGLGITRSSDPTPYKLLDGTEAAALHVWSMLVALREWGQAERILLPPAAINWIRRWAAKYRDEACPLVNTVEDLNRVYSGDRATWATDPAYHTKVLAAMASLFPVASSDGERVTTVAPIKANFRASLIPSGNPNRPGTLLNTNDRLWWMTQHTTGNTNRNAGAEMHRVFTHQGGGQYAVSFHFVVDDKEIIQLLPVYEIGWHAGDGCDDRGGDVGCFDSVGIELCVNSDGDWMAAKENLAILYAMLVTKDPRIIGIDRGDFSLQRVRTHQQVSDDRKYCPTQLLNEGSLPVIIGRAQVIATSDVATPIYAKPSIPAWLANDDGRTVQKIGRASVYPVKNEYTAIRDTPRRQATGLNHALIGPDIKKGETFGSGRVYRSAGETFVLTPYGTRVKAADLYPKVQVSTTGVVSTRF
jgi:N-acetylmuramoyl-L-alanine amidase